MLGAARPDRRTGGQRVRRDDQSPGGVPARQRERRRVGLGRSVRQLSRRSAPSIARGSSTASSRRCSTASSASIRPPCARCSTQRTRQMAIQCGEPGPVRADHRRDRPGVVGHGGAARRRAAVAAPRRHARACASTRAGSAPNGVVDVALRKRAEGFRAFKLKVGFGAERDVANLASLARSARRRRDDHDVDANQAWTPEDAAARIAELAPFRPHWIEEPIARRPSARWLARACARKRGAARRRREHPRHATLSTRRSTQGYLAFVQPDVGKWGGITAGSTSRVRAAAQRDVLPALARRGRRARGVDAPARGCGHAEELRGSRCESESAARGGVPDARSTDGGSRCRCARLGRRAGLASACAIRCECEVGEIAEQTHDGSRTAARSLHPPSGGSRRE